MGLGIEHLGVEGYYPKDANVDRESNPSLTSFCIDFEQNVLICRQLGNSKLGLNAEEELKRRIDAIELHKKIMPQYTLENSVAILQGENSNENVSVFARLTPKLNQVRPTSEMGFSDLLEDTEVCKALFNINLIYLRALINYRLFSDMGAGGIAGSNLPKVINKFTRHLATANIMTGYDNVGKKQVFVDPDWYITVEEQKKKNGTISIMKRILILGQNILFFGALNLYNNFKLKELNPALDKQKRIVNTN